MITNFIQKYRNEVIVGVIVFMVLILRDLLKNNL